MAEAAQETTHTDLAMAEKLQDMTEPGLTAVEEILDMTEPDLTMANTPGNDGAQPVSHT